MSEDFSKKSIKEQEEFYQKYCKNNIDRNKKEECEDINYNIDISNDEIDEIINDDLNSIENGEELYITDILKEHYKKKNNDNIYDIYNQRFENQN